MYKTSLEQDFELIRLEQSICNMTNREIVERLIQTIKSLMITTNQFRNIDELTLSQQFEVHRMQQAQLSRQDAIKLLIEAKRQLMIKQSVLRRFKSEVGLT